MRGIGHQPGTWQAFPDGPLEEIDPCERVRLAREQQHRHVDRRPVGAAHFPVGNPGSVERIAEADEAGTAAGLRGREEASHAATVRLTADEQLCRRHAARVQLLSIRRHRQFGLAQRQVDRAGPKAARAQSVDVPLHGGGPAGGAMGDKDVHQTRVATSVPHKVARTRPTLLAWKPQTSSSYPSRRPRLTA